MEQPVPSTAGRRQFNDTALAKLLAEGVPRNVAQAFINHGVDKSGRYAQLRDHVCKMEYVRYLLPRTVEDFRDPLRVGRLAPYVVDQRVQKFFTEFGMSDVEAARFTSAFPEFDVIPRGTTFNQHAFYANKRYAEAELLVNAVFDHAKSHPECDPRSLVDVGGNEVWHSKRDRKYIHNDNPVLSARDVARYTTREVFSGATGETTCSKKFSQCDFKADYGIGVHSTYDLSPRALAYGMCKRRMHAFFFVVNVVPGLGTMQAGQHEVDGMVITLHKPPRAPPSVSYTFKHDPSLEYSHPLLVHDAYLESRTMFHITRPDGSVEAFLYRIQSVRGNTLVGLIEKIVDPELASSSLQWSGPTRKVYYLTMKLLDVSRLEVDREFFDRLVFQACGARGAENYDIVSLYRYAKSLRQRVSINGIVLSSGYTMNPEHLVTCVIAAYALAAAFRVESAGFFKEASSQIHARRGQGFLRDALRITGLSLLAPFAALASVIGDLTFYTKANNKLKNVIAKQGAVQVYVDKPHAGRGVVFQPELLKKPPQVRRDGMVLSPATQGSSWITPLAPGGWDAKLSPTYVNCSGVDKVFLSYGVPRLDPREIPLACKPHHYDVSGFKVEQTVKSEEYRIAMYAMVLYKLVGSGAFDDKPLILPTGDRLYRKRMIPLDGEMVLSKASRMITDDDTYVVFRGVGDKAVALRRPDCYAKGHCVRFVLFYVDEVAEKLKNVGDGRQIGASSDDVAEAIRVLAGVGRGASVVKPVVGAQELGTAEAGSSTSEWEQVQPSSGSSSRRSRRVVSFAEHQAMTSEKRELFMTGARSIHTPPSSVASSDTLVYSSRGSAGHGSGLPTVPESSVQPGPPFQATVESDSEASVHPSRQHRRTESDRSVEAVLREASLFEESEDEPPAVSGSVGVGAGADTAEESVSSSEVVWCKEAMVEQVMLCDASRNVALSSAQEIIDLAVGAARGDVPYSMWGAVMEGKQGSPIPVRVRGGEFVNLLDGSKVEHMAVSDGEEVYDKICRPPPDGIYVTSDVMRVYTGAAIRDAVASVLNDPYQCTVTNMDGAAGSGKTYTITHEARVGDVVLCETTGALGDTAKRLQKLVVGWDGAAWTVDSFLMHRPRDRCNVLWVDESLRLHAAKIAAVIKLLKPSQVYCFGDSKQIPILPFVPGFDFRFSEFPFTSVTLKRDTWRSPADVCFMTSHSDFYGFHVMTHNPRARSVEGPLLFQAGMFHSKPPDVVLLTYTQIAKYDLQHAGVTNVMTIGESQGGTFDEVILYREDMRNKPLYFDKGQALVAMTRHRIRLRYVTVVVNDNSCVAQSIQYLRGKANELLLASHMHTARQPAVVVTSEPPESPEYDADWADAEAGSSSPVTSHGYQSGWARDDVDSDWL